eukprot:TRINITY_DN13700_c0_g2_i1.p1 TRINITY_DN13700_c0_g2~~TRINITY_DN13700_c0_g2_i1.p1  ORF type:complete len:443 (+),score=89.44 TRINITY_DN13700_c0_g2_i1:55-1329(+)
MAIVCHRIAFSCRFLESRRAACLRPYQKMKHVCLRVRATLFGSVLACSALAQQQGLPLKQQWPWYHTSEELKEKFTKLAADCPQAELVLSTETRLNTADAAGTQVNLDVAHIRRPSVQPHVKALLVFGEHARELITGEAALTLAQALCGKGSSASTEHATHALDQGVEFILVPNANPIGRQKVEEGFYCKRTNEDGVDLNRNWDEVHRNAAAGPGDEQYGGSAAFSEPETMLLRDLISRERPDAYLSVHSGAYMLGMPFGFDKEQRPKADDNEKMRVALARISEKYCKGDCPFGNLAELINYNNPGCDIDYVYQTLSTPYVFTWEIYAGQHIRERYIEQARVRSGRDEDAALMQTSLRGRRLKRQLSKLAAIMEMPEATQVVGDCMDQFNPQTPEETSEVAATWTGAFLDLSISVAAQGSSSYT